MSSDHLDLLGKACALAAAITWAFALVLFKRAGERTPPITLNLFKNAIGLLLFAVTLAVLGVRDHADGLTALRVYVREDFWILIFSGVVGIALADTMFFHALNVIGVGLISIVDCLYAPSTLLFAWLLLGEQLTLWQYLGAALILLGVFLSTGHTPPAGRTRAQLLLGMVIAGVAVVLMGFGIVLAKPVLEVGGFALLVWATAVRLLAGMAALTLLALASPQRRSHWSIFRPSGAWRVCVPGSILGTYVCLLLWTAGFKYTYAAIAAVLNQTTVIFAVILAALLLKERFTVRMAVAAVVALVGVVLVTLNGA